MISDGRIKRGGDVYGSGATVAGCRTVGQMFPEPLFDGRFRLLQRRLVGERRLQVMVESPSAAARC